VEKTPQLLVTGWIVRSIHCPLVLAEKLLALSFGKVSQDHQRIGGVFHRLRGHATQPTLAAIIALAMIRGRRQDLSGADPMPERAGDAT
jgi:hypothetical protein